MDKKLLTIGGGIGAAIFIVVLGFGCARTTDVVTTDDSGEIVVDRDAILLEAKETGLIMSDDEVGEMSKIDVVTDANMDVGNTASYLEMDFSTWASAALADVTGGSSYGLAHATYENGVYTLVSEFGNLSVPGDGYFYEGWIVRRGSNLSVVSTGPVEIVQDQYVNVFMSETNYSDHDFYVLTLEPDDGDSAPDEHILEGTLK